MKGALTAAELAVIGLAATPGLRLALDRPLWRLFPRLPALAAGGVAAGATTAVAAALVAPAVLHPLAALAGAGLAVATVRASPRFGRARGLPPGSLSLGSSLRALADRRYLLEDARRHGPVFKLQQAHRSVACVVGLERGHRLLREHEGSLEPLPLPFSRDVTGGFLRYMDDDVHAEYGAVFRRALATSVMRAAEPVARGAAARELRRLADAAARSGRGVRPLPSLQRVTHDAFVRALVGAAPGEPAHAAFEERYAALRRHDLSTPLTAEAGASLAALRALLHAEADRFRRLDPADVPVCALAAMLDARPDLPDATCIDNLVFIHRVATDNVTSLLFWLVATVGSHPEWAAALRREVPAGGAREEPDLVDRTVMETLRLAQSEYLYRRVAEDIRFDGHRLPRGWLLRVCVWESHRDPTVFERPEEFDPDRFRARRYRSSEYSPFGYGRHACNGVPLSNLVCRVLLEELAAGYEWTVDWDGSVERGLRHWRHWQPASTLELRLAPAGGAQGPVPRLARRTMPARSPTAEVARRSRSYVRVAGPDARELLQRTLSNDVEALAVGDACDALLLTPKARVVAPLVVWRRGDDDFLLLTEPELGDVVARQLTRLRVASKATIEREEHTSTIVFGGADGIPTADYGEPAVEVLDAELEPTLAADELERRRIAAGTPRWGSELDDRVLPAEAGLVERAVSLTKGCFPGQEPIARLHYRGHANRRLRSLVVGGEELPAYDAAIVLGEKAVGRVTSAAPLGDGTVLALGYVRREVTDDADLRVDGRPARLR